MAMMPEIELQAGAVAQAREVMRERIEALDTAIEAVKREHLPGIRQAVVAAKGDLERLYQMVDESRELFEKPRTRTFHDIRVGVMKQRGKVVVDDEAKTIKLIREQLPAAQAELLIKVTERVHKPAVYDLEARDLRRLAIALTDDTDVVTIKLGDSATDRLVNDLVGDLAEVEAG